MVCTCMTACVYAHVPESACVRVFDHVVLSMCICLALL